MNIRTLMIGATFATVLNCAAANAQSRNASAHT